MKSKVFALALILLGVFISSAIASHARMTSNEIVQLLIIKAEDLGDPGFDYLFDHGLVDAQAVGG